MPKVKVNATDYDGQIVIERLSYYTGFAAPIWAVPAWDEMGLPELSGPFASVEQAQAALDAINAE